MIIKGLVKEKRNVILYSLILFIVLSFLYLSVATALQINANKLKKEQVIKNEEQLVSLGQNVISYRLGRVVSDILYISDSLKLNNVDNTNFKNIENEWKAFLDRKNIYNQISYIDINGDEKIRVNYLESGSVIVGKDELQNKKDTYYFKDTVKLQKGQTYISKLELNIENGRIENPNKPTIRFCTPIYGSDNRLEGIMVLNYYAENILKQFEHISETSCGNMFLLNPSGYWVYNSDDKDKEWAFMYEEKKDINFRNQFPKEWNMINNRKGTFDTENGYYSYIKIIPDFFELASEMKIDNNSLVLGEGNWLAVSFIPKSSEIKNMIFTDVHTNVIYTLENYKFIFILIFAISVTFSFLIVINKMSKEKIKYFSEYDTMTGVLNRRAGFEKLNKLYYDLTKNEGKASICFIDINGLKEVNDTLGHEAGDDLILTIVNEIKNHITDKEFIIRLGGDEFLVIFSKSNEEEAEKVWNKINNSLKQINELEDRKYIVSASHGIEEFKNAVSKNIDDIINLADEKMYNEKRSIKKDFKVIKQI